MQNEPIDPRWPKLLSLAVHEFRTPITVAAGYIRMLLKERAGPISEQQRRLLEEAEKSCGRLSALVAEMSELSGLEAGTAGFNAAVVDLQSLLADVIGALPPLPDRDVNVELEADGPVTVNGDATRLKNAMTSLLHALRRELVTSDRLIVRLGTRDGAAAVAIGDPSEIDAVANADTARLERFNEWRGGSGLSLAIARRIIGQHGGTVHGAPGEVKASALVLIPAAN